MKKLILLIFIITKIYSQDWQKITNFERYPTGVIKVQENNKFQVGLPVKLKSNNNYYYYIITSITRDAVGNDFIFLNNTIPLTITEFYLGSENKVVVLFVNQEDIDYTWDDDTARLISIFGDVNDSNTDTVTVSIIIKMLKNNSNWLTLKVNSSRFNIDLPANRYKVSRNENLNIKTDKRVKLYLRFVME